MSHSLFMKAIYLTQYGNSESAFEIREAPVPNPGPNEVIIKVAASGLNFADVLARRGLYPDAPKNPAILGYDVAGVIHDTGANVKKWKTGQKVFALTRFGGYAEYVNAQVEAIAPIPKGYDFPLSTALATQACTALYCMEEAIQIHAGDHVLIHAAAGGVGSILVQLAQHHGCVVYGTASTHKIEFLNEMKVDVPIDYTIEDFSKVIKKMDTGIDVVFDSIGGKTFRKGYKLLNPGGRIVTFGVASQLGKGIFARLKSLNMAVGFGIYSPIPLLVKSTGIIGVYMLAIATQRPHIFQQVLNKIVRYAENGVITPVLSKTFQAEEIAEAHDFFESRQSIGKIAIVW